MERLVNLNEILDDENFTAQKGDYVQVNTVWTSGRFKTKNNKPVCKFIFADKDGTHIGGVLFCYGRTLSAQMRKKLEKQSCWFKIANFKVDNVEDDDWCSIRGQTRLINIRVKAENVQEINLNIPINKYLPFEFISLEDVDNCPVGTKIDVIGYATEVSKKLKSKNGNEYKTVTICSTASKSGDNKFLRKVALYGRCMKQVTRKNAVYAMLNVRVKEHGRAGEENKTLDTVETTIIWKIKESDKLKLPPEFRDTELIHELFPKKRQRAPKLSNTSSATVPLMPNTVGTPTHSQILREAMS